MKVVWLGKIKAPLTTPNLLVAHFEKKIKLQLVKAIGLNF
jgi:hypothetical protein